MGTDCKSALSGNTFTLVELAHGSRWANWVRGGQATIPSISRGLKLGGATLGVIGIGFGINDFMNNKISGLEFGVDTTVAALGILAAFVTAPAWITAATVVGIGSFTYFAGKAIYEYSSNNTMYEKPKN